MYIARIRVDIGKMMETLAKTITRTTTIAAAKVDTCIIAKVVLPIVDIALVSFSLPSKKNF